MLINLGEKKGERGWERGGERGGEREEERGVAGVGVGPVESGGRCKATMTMMSTIIITVNGGGCMGVEGAGGRWMEVSLGPVK